MTLTETSTDYEIGEEVVVILGSLRVRTEGGAVLASELLPTWTIATVVLVGSDEPRYRLSFTLGDERCICDAPGGAIEGTA